MDFSKFDSKVDIDGLKKDIAEAKSRGYDGDYPEIPKGKYEVRIEKMEMRETKKDARPMFSVSMSILEGEYKKLSIFMNRVLFGTKNDGNMIQSVIGWMDKLGTEINIDFESYSQFADLILDVAEKVDELDLEYLVEYDPNAFNSIAIKKIFEN